jgi:hypothetical protein
MDISICTTQTFQLLVYMLNIWADAPLNQKIKESKSFEVCILSQWCLF